MKEATGELSMTVVTIIAIVGIVAIVSGFLVPEIGKYIKNQWGNISGKEADTGLGYVEVIDKAEYTL